GHIKDGHNGFSVAYFPLPDASQCIRKWPGHYLDELIWFTRGRRGPEVRRPKEMDRLVREPRCRPDRRQPFHARGFDPGLFHQLTPRTTLGGLALVQPAGRDFPNRSTGRVSVLS